MSVPWLKPDCLEFPDPEQALGPHGLIAAGGDLSTERLLAAYRLGIFPWYEEGQPILWWSPDPRLVLVPSQFHVSRSLGRLARQGRFDITLDTDFAGVVRACAGERRSGSGTWITEAMQSAYCALHGAGYAHSVEIWDDDRLAGGLYGVAIGRVFFGESMFSHVPNASKLALMFLARTVNERGFQLIDCQVVSSHLVSLGAVPLTRSDFLARLGIAMIADERLGNWQIASCQVPREF